MYSVGQLAKRTGISIRTLHYYEKLGLLQPARNTNGYRQYGEADLMRLQQITVLKQMGFTLSRIGTTLGKMEADGANGTDVWNAALEQQLSVVKQKQEQLRSLELLLHSAQYAAKASGRVDLEELLGFIQQLEAPPVMPKRSKHFTEEELAALPVNDFDNPLVMEWAGMLHEIGGMLHEEADSPASQRMAARIAAYAEELFGGDEALTGKFWSYLVPEEGQPPVLYGMTAEVTAYIDRILEVYFERTRTDSDASD